MFQWAFAKFSDQVTFPKQDDLIKKLVQKKESILVHIEAPAGGPVASDATYEKRKKSSKRF